MSHYSFSKGNPSLTVSCPEKRVKQLAGSVQFSFKIISVQPFSFITKNIDWLTLVRIFFLDSLWYLVQLSLIYCLSFSSLITSLIGLTKSFAVLPKQFAGTHKVQVQCSLSLFVSLSFMPTHTNVIFLQLQI